MDIDKAEKGYCISGVLKVIDLVVLLIASIPYFAYVTYTIVRTSFYSNWYAKTLGMMNFSKIAIPVCAILLVVLSGLKLYFRYKIDDIHDSDINLVKVKTNNK